ncbi:Sialoadhesin [Manis pentadactyla]|nr:Sialoadhesin [Manis pentadactyla]
MLKNRLQSKRKLEATEQPMIVEAPFDLKHSYYSPHVSQEDGKRWKSPHHSLSQSVLECLWTLSSSDLPADL